MKNKILTLVLAVMALTTVTAQKRMVIHVGGEEIVNIEVWRIDQVSFEPEEEAVANAAGQQIMMGDLKWADRNLEATQGEKLIQLVGWGDTTMTNLSKKLQYFPIASPTTGIADSNYDVARYKWGSGWRLPTKEELEALLAASTRKWINRNDSIGCMLTIGNDSIFLPALGYREGETVTAAGEEVWIWSGTLGTTSTDNAIALKLSEGANPEYVEVARYRGCAIRPVAGRIRVPVSVSQTVVTPDKTTATVVATIGGDKDDIDFKLIGICYAKTQEALIHGDSNDDNHKVTTTLADEVTFNFSGLDMNTTYYARVYVKIGDSYTDGEVVAFKTLAKFPVPDYVDLGLPSGVRWAKWNMGSSSELDIPNTTYARFGWGDPTGEIDSPSPSAYAAYEWNWQSSKDISGTKYDIASVQWGDKWRIPTPADFTEISESSGYTTWEYGNWADEAGNGYPAWKVTSKKDPTKYIYFPGAGLIRTNGVPDKVRDYAYYWTSVDEGYGVAKYAEIIRDAYILSTDYGVQMPIRPVYGKPGEFSPGVDPVTPDPDPNPDPDPVTPVTPETAEVGIAVDLGLPSGTKWADRNIGAVSVSDYGDYIQWGDSIERNVYTITDYIHYAPSDQAGFKYLGTSTDHTDVYSIAGTEYDAAHYRWGGSWVMPTETQFNELLDYCDWTWTTQNGVNGYKVVSRNNGRSIFLPAAGYKSGSPAATTNPGVKGYYWTVDLRVAVEDYINKDIITFEFTSSSHLSSYDPRYKGLTIRPVQR